MNEAPLFVARKGEELVLPKDVPIFYVLTSNGLYIGRNTPFFSSLVKANKGPSHLGEVDSGVRFQLPKFSPLSFRRVWAFFREVAKRHNGSEAAGLLVARNGSQGELDVVIPEQKVSAYDVKFEAVLPKGEVGVIVGDIHSHGYGGAYASMTDKDDEEFKAGLHIILGHIDYDNKESDSEWKRLSAHVDFVVDGVRCKVSPGDVIPIDVAEPLHLKEVPIGWFAKVEHKKWGWEGDDKWKGDDKRGGGYWKSHWEGEKWVEESGWRKKERRRREKKEKGPSEFDPSTYWRDSK